MGCPHALARVSRFAVGLCAYLEWISTIVPTPGRPLVPNRSPPLRVPTDSPSSTKGEADCGYPYSPALSAGTYIQQQRIRKFSISQSGLTPRAGSFSPETRLVCRGVRTKHHPGSLFSSLAISKHAQSAEVKFGSTRSLDGEHAMDRTAGEEINQKFIQSAQTLKVHSPI